MIGKTVNYMSQYKPYIRKYESVPRDKVQPMNVYKIKVYKKSDDPKVVKKALEELLIFSFGIYNKELFVVKLNNIKPMDFFKWLEKVLEYDKLKEITEETLKFRSVIKEFNRNGKDFYLQHVKTSHKIKPNNETYVIKELNYLKLAMFDFQKINKLYEKNE